jgi:hypothetical protein
MPDQRPLAANLLLDALSEFERVIEALPGPGRGGAIGRLNAGVATLLHIAEHADRLRSVTTGDDLDPWIVERLDRDAAPPAFNDVLEAYRRVQEGLTTLLESATAEELARVSIPKPIEGLPAHLTGATAEYLVARTAAHVFVHAGELAALASLVGAPDLGLPGAMTATRGTDG